MIKTILRVVLLFCFFILPNRVLADKAQFSLDLQHVSIQDSLRMVAKCLHQNIILSPQIAGTVSIHLHDMTAQNAFDLLLLSHDLAKQKLGNTWFIMPRAEWIQRQQDSLKWQTDQENTSPLVTRIWPVRYAKAQELGHLLQDNNNSFLSKRGHIEVDARTNTICVQDTETSLNQVQHLIARLDVPVKQILLEARLASIDFDFERNLGLNFSVNAPVGSDAAGHYSLAVARLPNGSQLDVQLTALENSGHGELISSPSLFTGNQQTASIESGEEIPYQEISRSGGTAIAFKKAVLSLKVTPQILSHQQVLLELQVNQDRPGDRIVQGVPAITTRQIATNIMVHNGQTIVLGGIYEMNKENAEQRIPFLGKMPLVGWLFKQQNVKTAKRELLIFVTPKIIC